MKISTGQKIAIGVGLAVLLQLANGLSAYRSAADYFGTAEERRASYRVLQISDVFLSNLRDSETGQRGYLLTGDEAYLLPYDKGTKALPKSFQEFRESTGTEHERRLAMIEPLVQEKLKEMRETIEIRRRDPLTGQAAALKIVQTNAGKQLMDRVRGAVQEIDGIEQRHAALLSERMDQLARGTLFRMFLLSSVAVVLVGAAGVVVYRDLNRRVFAEDKLREQSSVLKSILDSMSDPVIVADPEGRLTLFNAAAERQHGRGVTGKPVQEWSEIYGLYRLDRITPYPADELPLMLTIKGQIVDNREIYIRPGHGDAGFYVSFSGRPIIDDQGTMRGGVIVGRDITPLKEAELKIRRQNEELDRRVQERTAELARTNADLRQKNQENEMFVYSVSHDLRSPLVNLQGFSQELLFACEGLRSMFSTGKVPEAEGQRGLKILDDDVAPAVRFIQTAVTRLANIINALLRLSRAGRVEYQLRAVPMLELVEGIVASRHGDVQKANVEVKIETLAAAWGDSTALEQVFSNLFDNALKYLDPDRKGSIVIGMDSDRNESERQMTYFVRDNGLGIPEQGRDKAFRAFERLHPKVGTGEGMGLAIVARTVERHGGRIELESKVGIGSTFYVTLPTVPQSDLMEREIAAGGNHES